MTKTSEVLALGRSGHGHSEQRWNLWEDEEYLMGCVLYHHARKGIMPWERHLEKELLISEGSGYPSGVLWDLQSNLSSL